MEQTANTMPAAALGQYKGLAFSDTGRTRRVKASPLYCPKAAAGMVFAVCSIVEHSFL